MIIETWEKMWASQNQKELVLECPLCRAKLRLVFHYGLFGWTPPPEVEGEFYVDPEGWRIVQINPYYFQPISNCLSIYRKNKPRLDMI